EFQSKLPPSPCAGRGNLAEIESITDGGGGNAKDMPVESVKHPEAEFKVHLLSDVSPLHDPEVLVIARENPHVEKTWGIPECEGRRDLECRNVEKKVRRGIEIAGVAFLVHTGNYVGKVARIEQRQGIVDTHADRCSRLVAHDSVDLPTAQDFARRPFNVGDRLARADR